LLAATGALFTPGCDRVLTRLAELAGDRLPERAEVPDGEEVDPAHTLLARASFGPRPGDLERVRAMGAEAWIDEQLAPERIDEHACELRTSVIDSVHLPTPLLFELPPEQLEVELSRHALLRATYARRQLLEVLVEAWSDHFHVSISKGACKHLKTVDDREVVRRHALGSFRDLLAASVLSPAMLVYLDGRENRREKPSDVPNENHARELLELHTLGVHGGYTQADVMEVARCLTGFVVRDTWAPGAVEFVPERHDDGEKRVLGQVLPAGGGRADVDRVLDLLAAHPSTARHVSTRLAKALVADDPPRALVESAAQTFLATGGDLRKVVRALLVAPELVASSGAKLKRPFRLLVSMLRALGADTHGRGPWLEHLTRMGHRPYSWPTPDGAPTEADPWLDTVLERWKLASALAEGRLEGVTVPWAALRRSLGEPFVPRLAAHLFGRRPRPAELEAIEPFSGDERRALALLLSSPAFQVQG
jgi:uncharacterized protein (DUF1800 family)